jgi:hypothetical protein
VEAFAWPSDQRNESANPFPAIVETGNAEDKQVGAGVDAHG